VKPALLQRIINYHEQADEFIRIQKVRSVFAMNLKYPQNPPHFNVFTRQNCYNPRQFFPTIETL
jgi:hypothetical protein